MGSDLTYLIILSGVAGIAGFLLHQHSYRKLYRKMSARDLVGNDYRPAPMSAVWDIGCLGYITKLKREIGIDALSSEERVLLKIAVYAYYAGTLAMFFLVCIIFWTNYR